MSRRASLPGASELFRLTSSPALEITHAAETHAANRGGNGNGNGNGHQEQLAQSGAVKRGSGRTKHDAKITVYVSGDELLALEQARLTLRGSHDLVVDRGRLVREAVAVLLSDFEEHGEESVLVQRLRAAGAGDDEEAEG